MTFIESLNNLMLGIDTGLSRRDIESKFRDKLPTILAFIDKDINISFERLLDVFIRSSKDGCIVQMEDDSFTLSSIHPKDKTEFKCDIDFKIELNPNSIKNITCYFDDDLNIKSFSYKMNFGSYLSGNSFFIENTRYVDGKHQRKIYLLNVHTSAITMIDNLNVAVHQEDPDFEMFLSKMLLTHYTKREFYIDAFNYLPVIDLVDPLAMSSFINELHERYINKDRLIEQSLELLDMHNV